MSKVRPREAKTLLTQVTARQEVAQESPSSTPLQAEKSHVGLGLQPPELSAPEGELSVSGELFSSSHPRPPSVSHGPGKEWSLRGRLPWEVVQGALGAAPSGWWQGVCTCSGACTCSCSLWLLYFLYSSSRGMSAAESAPPDWGLPRRSLQGQKGQGTLEMIQAGLSALSVRSRVPSVRTGAAWQEVGVLLRASSIEHRH